MGWRHLHSGTTADIRFRAASMSFEGLLSSAVDAVVASMVGDPAHVRPREERRETVRAHTEEMLLFEVLQRIIFHKDAAGLILRLASVSVSGAPGDWSAEAVFRGERIDPARHALAADVKAVTFQGYRVVRRCGRWTAEIVLDV